MTGLDALWQAHDLFVAGAWITLQLLGCCLALAVPLGLGAFAGLAEGPPAFARAGRLLADGLRCVPFLLFAYLVYYGLPALGLRLEPFAAGLVTMVVYNTAYFCEIFRSQAQVIAPDSRLAAEAFGFSRRKLYQRIVFPQLLRAAAPMLANQAVMVMKDSALLMVITIQDITFAANFVSTNAFAPFAPFVLALALYWVLSLGIDLAVGRMTTNDPR